MRDYYFVYKMCKQQLLNLGITPGYVSDIKLNGRAKTRWGLCHYNHDDDSYTIEIAACLICDTTPVEALTNTMMHELIHTVDGCMNHKQPWKSIAEKVNEAYGYNVQRVNSYKNEEGVNPLRTNKDYHYIVTCQSCNSVFKYIRNCHTVESCRKNNATCSCGGKRFTVVNI